MSARFNNPNDSNNPDDSNALHDPHFDMTTESTVLYYAVHKGHGAGVYDTWDEAKEAVHGVEGAVFKAFDAQWDADFFVTHGVEPRYEDRLAAVDKAQESISGVHAVDVVFRARRSQHIVEWWDASSRSMVKTTPFINGASLSQQEVVAACRLLERWTTVAPLPSVTDSITIGFSQGAAYNAMTKHMRVWQQNNWLDSRKKPVAIAGELEAACDALDSKRLPCAVQYRVSKLGK